MALPPEELAHLNRQARRRAERAAEEMSFRDVSSEEYLRRLRARRRPGRPFEVEDIPAAVEIGEEPLDPQPEYKRPTAPGRQRSQSHTVSTGSTTPGPNPRGLSKSGSRRPVSGGPIPRNPSMKVPVRSERTSSEGANPQPGRERAMHQPPAPAASSVSLNSAAALPHTQPQRPRSSLSIFGPKKSVRRAASVAVLSSKQGFVDAEMASTTHQASHVRSRSLHVPSNVSDPSLRPGTLSKRSSLRSLKDTIRRVASSLELRSLRRDNSDLAGDITTLKHRKSSKSLLSRSSRRVAPQQRLGTVSEEA